MIIKNDIGILKLINKKTYLGRFINNISKDSFFALYIRFLSNNDDNTNLSDKKYKDKYYRLFEINRP